MKAPGAVVSFLEVARRDQHGAGPGRTPHDRHHPIPVGSDLGAPAYHRGRACSCDRSSGSLVRDQGTCSWAAGKIGRPTVANRLAGECTSAVLATRHGSSSLPLQAGTRSATGSPLGPSRDSRHRQRWTSGDTHGRPAAGHACGGAGSLRRYLASDEEDALSVGDLPHNIWPVRTVRAGSRCCPASWLI